MPRPSANAAHAPAERCEPRSGAEASGGWRVALAMLAASLLVLPLLTLRQPAAGEQVALIFPPGTQREAALAALDPAALRAVRGGRWDNLLVVETARDMSWRELWDLGAMAAFDPLAFGFCLVSNGVEQ